MNKRAIASVLALWVGYLVIIEVTGVSFTESVQVDNQNSWRQKQIDTHSQWARWDSFRYLTLARDGYQYDPPRYQNVTFFPLYSWTLRGLALVLPIELDTAGVWLSRLLLLLAMFLLVRYARDGPSADDPIAPVVAMLAFPTAFVFGAVYTESMFLVLVLGAFVLAKERRYLPAAGLAALASLTRMLGLALAPAFLLLAWQRYREGERRPSVLLLIAAPGVGFATLMIVFSVRFGDPLLFVNAHGESGRGLFLPWVAVGRALASLLSPPAVVGWSTLTPVLELVLVVVVGVIGGRLYRAGERAEAALVLTTLLLVLTAGSLQSLERYVVVLFPLFLFVARARKHPVLWPGYLISAALLQGLLIARFVLYLPPPP